MLTTRTLLSVSALLTSSVVLGKGGRFAAREDTDDAATLQENINIKIPGNNTVTLRETTIVVTVPPATANDPYPTSLISTVAAQATTVDGTLTTIAAFTTEIPTVLARPPVTVFQSAVKGSATCAPPEPSAGASYDPKSNLLWGCAPGFICSPRKPEGCNFWSGLPAPNYVCAAEDCLPAEPAIPARWDENTTGQYPLVPQYFPLNPAHYGLSADIFDQELEILDIGEAELYTARFGDWGTRAPDAPLPTLGVRQPHAPGRKVNNWKRKPWMKAMEKHLLRIRQLTGVNPAICFSPCNDAALEAERVGLTPEICNPGSAFRQQYDACQLCIGGNIGNGTQVDERITPSNAFVRFFEFCEPVDAVQGNTGGGNAQSQLGQGGGSVGVSSGIEGVGNATAVPINPRPTATPTTTRNGTVGPTGGALPSGTGSGTRPTSTGPIQGAADTLRASGLLAIALPLFGAFLFL